MQLPYKARFGGAKFGRGWNQLMYDSLTLLRGAHKLYGQVFVAVVIVVSFDEMQNGARVQPHGERRLCQLSAICLHRLGFAR